MLVTRKSFVNRFVEADIPQPRELFSSALAIRNHGLFSEEDYIPVVSGRTLDNIDDLLNFDKQMASEEATKSE